MLSILRGQSPPRTTTASHNPVIYENGRSRVEFHPPSTRHQHFMMTNVLPPTEVDTTKNPTIIQPPFHFHVHQSERFKVLSGTGHFYMGLSRKPFVTLSGPGPGAGSGSTETNTNTNTNKTSKNTASIPARRYHRFENASATQPLVLEIQLDPENYEAEVCFFRNFFGYLDDCGKQKMQPSVFQLMVFLHAADTPLAIPLGVLLGEYWGERVGVVVSVVVMNLLAFWGRVVLGYRPSYSEYYHYSRDAGAGAGAGASASVNEGRKNR